jgi:histone deacetylase 1/2
MSRVVQVFAPSVIVLQCGADSLAGDKLGDFNLTLKGHGKCVEYIRSLNVPTIMLGGGGYTIRNVSRCWANETAIALGEKLDNDLPYCTYYNYFAPDHKLHIEPIPTRMNHNTTKYLHDTIINVFENLASIPPVPSVQIQEIPHSFENTEV